MPLELILLGGLAANIGLKGNTPTQLNIGLAPYLAAGVEKQVSSKISINTHIGFTYHNALNTQYNFANPNYSFGRDSSLYLYNYKRLVQLQLPISLSYQLSQKHSLLTSIGLTYILNAIGNETETRYSTIPAQTSVSKSTVSSTLYSNKNVATKAGINPLNAFVQIGYGYKLNASIMLQAAFQLGLTDVTKNSYFNNLQKNNASRLSIGLKYNFKRNNP
jgi:hypothetical protein